MIPDLLTTWALAHPWAVAATAGAILALTAGAVWCAVRAVRTSEHPASVRVAAAGAIVCTAYSADTSWRFAEHRLGMTDFAERMVMFGAAEIALLACALMARANKAATVTQDNAGTTGVPGVLVWVITGVQIIPAYSESGFVGGTVRAVIGPVMAGLLWHLAMGLEIRIKRPSALSSGLLAQIGRELRERLLSRIGLATRDRTAEQITRDRAAARAVRLASRRWLGPWGRHRLAAAATKSGAAMNGEQLHSLMRQLSARRTSEQLRTVSVPSPWTIEPVPEPYPSTPLGVTGALLRTMDPLDAVHQVRAAHPSTTPAELASLCTEYGVPVTETQVRVAVGAGNPPPARQPLDAARTRPVLDAVSVPAPDVPGPGLQLDLAPMGEVHPAMGAPVPVLAAEARRTQVHARVPEHPTLDYIRRRAAEERARAAEPSRTRPVPAVPDPSTAGTDDDAVLDRARELDAAYLKAHKRHVPIHVLKSELHIGQTAAQRLQRELKGAQK